MEKHLLVAVGDAHLTSLSLRYVRGFFTRRDDLTLTLFYVVPKKTAYDASPSNQQGPSPAPEQAAPVVADVDPTLESARKWLLEQGFAKDRIKVKSAPGQLGVVKDIIRESEAGLYDAVVLGRRGLSWFDEMFADSVSHKILWEAITFPIWVCREPEPDRRDVLLCLDGSDECLRVADHVGFMLGDEPDHRITLFSVEKNGHQADTAAVFGRASRILKENGLGPERLREKVVQAKSAAEAILAEAGSGRYAAVAVGRTGGRPSGLGSIFATTSLKLLRGLTGATLWLCK